MLLKDCKTITGRAVKETEEQSEFVVARPSKLSRIFFFTPFQQHLPQLLTKIKGFHQRKTKPNYSTILF